MNVEKIDYFTEFLSLFDNTQQIHSCDEQWDAYSSFIWNLSQKLFKGKAAEEQKKFKQMFMSFKTDTNRFEYITADKYFSEEIDAIYSELVNRFTRSEEKSFVKANNAVNEGMLLMNTSPVNYEKAEKCFSKAINNTSFSSDLFGEYLKMRGICLYECKHFNDASKDFSEAIQLIKSKKEIPCLLFMKSECLRQIGENEESKKAFKEAEQAVSTCHAFDSKTKNEIMQDFLAMIQTLTDDCSESDIEIPVFTDNWKIPGAKKCIEISSDSRKGRLLKTTANLKKGSVIMSEKGIATWLSPCYYRKYCHFCLKMIEKRFITCRVCKAVKYCSLLCEEKAWLQYHSVECKFLDVLKYFSFAHLALRLVIIFGFENILQTIKSEHVSLEDCCALGFPNSYSSFYSFFGDSNHLSFEQLFCFCVGVLLTAKVAEEMHLISRQTPQYFIFAEILLKHIFQININCFSSTDKKMKFRRDLQLWTFDKIEKIGIVMTFGTALVSHSCDFNCDWYTIGSQVVLITNREILAGEELTITYFPHYKRMSFRDRQEFLKEHYLFDCRCEACEYRYENVDFAFRCGQCSGALIWNSDMTGHCIKCFFASSNVSELYNQSQRAVCHLNEAKLLLNNKEIHESKRYLEKAYKINKKLYYSFVHQLAVLEQFCIYHSLKNNYNHAFNQCLSIAAIHRQLTGSDSMEQVAYMVKGLQYLMQDIDSSILCKSSKRKKGREVCLNMISIIENVKHEDIKSVPKNMADYLKHIATVCAKFGVETKSII